MSQLALQTLHDPSDYSFAARPSTSPSSTQNSLATENQPHQQSPLSSNPAGMAS